MTGSPLVFLVSMKLMLGGRKAELGTERLERRLEAIQEQLETHTPNTTA